MPKITLLPHDKSEIYLHKSKMGREKDNKRTAAAIIKSNDGRDKQGNFFSEGRAADVSGSLRGGVVTSACFVCDPRRYC